MSDRELLELAAKAAGYELLDVGDYQIYDKEWRDWNPLTNDGDAFRLAVILLFSISFAPESKFAWIYHEESELQICEQIGLCAATSMRRAIVRAAAEIGRAMP